MTRPQACLRVGAAVLLCLTAACSRETVEKPGATPPSKVLALLEAPGQEADLEAWRAISPEPMPELLRIAGDESRSLRLRVRATDALAAFPTDAVRDFLVNVLDEEVRVPVCRAAVRSLVKGWGDHALPLLSPRLKHREPLVREAMVYSLEALATPKARDMLAVMAAGETHPVVRQSISAAQYKLNRQE